MDSDSHDDNDSNQIDNYNDGYSHASEQNTRDADQKSSSMFVIWKEFSPLDKVCLLPIYSLILTTFSFDNITKRHNIY